MRPIEGCPLGEGEATVAVCAGDAAEPVRRRAAQLAVQLDLPLVHAGDSAFEMLLTVTADRLELRFPRPGGSRPLYVDFVNGRHGPARGVQRYGLLFRAIGLRSGPVTVLDATAGLGRAAFHLAFHGCHVAAIERSPILFALFQDGLDRAARVREIHEQLQGRLRAIHGDSRDYLQRLAIDDAPDVVYLDPMFPVARKPALVKVEMRILRRLVGDDVDACELFAAARAAARKRVVVKRNRRDGPLAPNPNHSHGDGITRYDVYLRFPQQQSSATRPQPKTED